MNESKGHTAWEVEAKDTRSPEAHYAVIDEDGCVLFDTYNADVRRYQIDSDPDDDGGTRYYQKGPAVDALRLAAAAPELLAELEAYHDSLCEGEGCTACVVIAKARGKEGAR